MISILNNTKYKVTCNLFKKRLQKDIDFELSQFSIFKVRIMICKVLLKPKK